MHFTSERRRRENGLVELGLVCGKHSPEGQSRKFKANTKRIGKGWDRKRMGNGKQTDRKKIAIGLKKDGNRMQQDRKRKANG